MNDEFLPQEAIDALLQQAQNLPAEEQGEPETGLAAGVPVDNPSSFDDAGLSSLEMDVLGEIANISMGTAATALSQILNHKVTLTAPQIRITTPGDLFRSFEIPYAVVTVQYTSGLTGNNLLIVRLTDAAVIADLMMGGDGRSAAELGEIGISAVSEAMNQMMGSAATSMSSMFQTQVIISPPKIAVFDTVHGDGRGFYPWGPETRVAVVSFRMTVEGLVDSRLLQVVPVAVAKQEAGFLLEQQGGGQAANAVEAPQPAAPVFDVPPVAPPVLEVPAPAEPAPAVKRAGSPPPRNLDLLLDVPLDVSVIMGRTHRPIKEVLSLVPGAVVELDRLVQEPVEILVNGTLVAEGEVVVANENFGVRITRIIGPAERLKYLRQAE